MTSNLAHLAKYCHLSAVASGPSMSKTMTSVFHQRNNRSPRELNTYVYGQRLRHDTHAVYLGVPIDRTMSYREHLRCSGAKVKSCKNTEICLYFNGCPINIVYRSAFALCADGALRIYSLPLALCYSVAEYAVWCGLDTVAPLS